MPGKQWADDSDDSSSGSEASSAPAVPAGALRRATKFEDEEENDSDVLDSWDADDSEVEREKAKAEAKAKVDAEAAKAKAAANKKSKGLRIAERQAQRQAELDAAAEPLENETEAERRERMRRSEQEADLQHAADLFGDAGLSAGTGSRKSAAALKAAAVAVDKSDPTKTVDLASLPLMNPTTKAQFDTLRVTLAPLLAANVKKPHYSLFVQELVKELCKALPSDQIKKTASTLTVLGNDKLREEKAAEKGGKKSKAAKTKTSLAVGRPNTVDTGAYDDDGFGDDDFM